MPRRREMLALTAGAMAATGVAPAFDGATQEQAQEQDAGDGEPFFVAAMTGAQHVPPIETPARGAALFSYGQEADVLHYALAVADIEDVTVAHIHAGSPADGGPIVVWLYPGPAVQSPRPIDGHFDGVLSQGTVTSADLVGPLEGEPLDALLEDLAAGDAYVNVHTAANPGGEITGTVLPLGQVVSAVAEWQSSEDAQDADGTATTPGTATEPPTETGTETAGSGY